MAQPEPGSLVPAQTNEHKAALALLKAMVLQGRVVTGDAAFCQRDLCRQVVDDGGHYLIKVDDNQPTLMSDIAAAFGPAFSPLRPAEGGRAGR
jgi:predicted transposase YbfD/YdcC